MKELNYNEITKEIDIKKKKDERKKRKKRKKRFYKTFASIILTVVNVIISCVAVNSSKKTEAIYQEQLNILKDDREPCFSLVKREDAKENEIGYFYTLKNVGGRISNAASRIRKYIEIHILYDEEIGTIIFRCPISTRYYTRGIARYDQDDKSFLLYGFDCKDIDIMEKDLENKIFESVDFIGSNEISVFTLVRTYIEIFYKNYNNEQDNTKYEIYYDTHFIQEYSEDDVIYLKQIDEGNINSIVEQIQKEIYRKNSLVEN